jgi:hypothetical protein
MSIYFKLDKQIDANQLLQKIQKLINTTQINEDSIIEISIKNIAYNDHSMIPKLEYKNEENNI